MYKSHNSNKGVSIYYFWMLLKKSNMIAFYVENILWKKIDCK